MSSAVLLLEAIGYLDEDLLERSEEKQKPKRMAWVAWTALAACLCLICTASVLLMDGFGAKSADNAMEVIDDMENIGDPAEEAQTAYSSETYTVSDSTGVGVSFEVHFFRTGIPFGTEDTQTAVINSREELEQYILVLENGMGSAALEDEIQKYDDAFFAEKQLIVFAIEADSSSVSYNVLEITENQNGWSIQIERNCPEVLTTDAVSRLALIETEAGLIDANDKIEIQYSDNIACD